MVNWNIFTPQFIAEMFLLAFLILFAFIDIKKKQLPSILTTSVLFVLAIVKINNLPYGILAGIFGWLLMEGFTEEEYGRFFSGVADLKITIMLGFMISSLGGFLILCILIVVYGVLYKVVMIKFFEQKEEVAFIPVFLLVFITLILIEVFTNVKIF